MIYLIEQYDFDSMENHPAAARIRRIVGFTNRIGDARQWVAVAEKTHKREKEYDGIIYPHWSITPVEMVVWLEGKSE